MNDGLRPDELVFLLDVDNTLLDNDRFGAELGAHLAAEFGAGERDRYWAGFAALRAESGYADYLAALQRFRSGLENEPALLHMSAWLLDYPFAGLVYPRAREAIEHLRTMGRPVILSDGEVVFQPRKIQRSGLWEILQGAVL
ncbi:MAG TPA: haloacid dehalogenase-like hydrolase, partial [Steroidobacteraceae bacterium]|nr:haloacid dehalogenase-like hydrolase [Steroidobacteraceae bacterium]